MNEDAKRVKEMLEEGGLDVDILFVAPVVVYDQVATGLQFRVKNAKTGTLELDDILFLHGVLKKEGVVPFLSAELPYGVAKSDKNVTWRVDGYPRLYLDYVQRLITEVRTRVTVTSDYLKGADAYLALESNLEKGAEAIEMATKHALYEEVGRLQRSGHLLIPDAMAVIQAPVQAFCDANGITVDWPQLYGKIPAALQKIHPWLSSLNYDATFISEMF